MSVVKRLIEEYGEEAVEKAFKRLIESVNDDGLPTKWAKDELDEAIKLEITDGTNPEMFATRQEVAIMGKRVLKKCTENTPVNSSEQNLTVIYNGSEITISGKRS